MGLFDFFGDAQQPEQLSGPIDPAATQVDYGSPTSIAGGASQGMDFTKILQAAAHGAGAGMAVGNRDPYYLMRYQGQQATIEEGKKRTDLAERAMDQEQMKNLPQTLQSMEALRDMMADLSEDRRNVHMPKVVEYFKKSGLPPEMVSAMMTLPGEGQEDVLQRVKDQYPLTQHMPPDRQRAIWKLVKDKKTAEADRQISNYGMSVAMQQLQGGEDVSPEAEAAMSADDRKNFEVRASRMVESNVHKLIDAGAINKDVTQDQFRRLVRNSQYLDRGGEDAWLRINERLPGIKGAKQATEERKELERDKNKAESEANVQRRHDENLQQNRENQNRLAGQFATHLSFQQQQEERRRAEQEERERKNRMISPTQQKSIAQQDNAVKSIDALKEAYDEFIKETKGGKVSSTLKGAIAKNAAATRLSDLVQAEGTTPAEKKLAAVYRATVGNLKQLSDEPGVFTDVDAFRILGSFDISQTPEQVKANLAEARKARLRARETFLQSYEDMGKDVSGFRKREAQTQPGTPGGTQTMRSTSKSGKPIVSNDGGKTWTYE